MPQIQVVTNCYNISCTVTYGPERFPYGTQPSVAATVKPFCTTSTSATGSPITEMSLDIHNLTWQLLLPNLYRPNSSAANGGDSVKSAASIVSHRQPVLLNRNVSVCSDVISLHHRQCLGKLPSLVNTDRCLFCSSVSDRHTILTVQFVAQLRIHAPSALAEGRSGTALYGLPALIPFPPFVYVVMNLIT